MYRILIPTRLAQEGVDHLADVPGFKVDFRPGGSNVRDFVGHVTCHLRIFCLTPIARLQTGSIAGPAYSPYPDGSVAEGEGGLGSGHYDDNGPVRIGADVELSKRK